MAQTALVAMWSLVPLAMAPFFTDAYGTPKWIALGLLALVGLLSLRGAKLAFVCLDHIDKWLLGLVAFGVLFSILRSNPVVIHSFVLKLLLFLSILLLSYSHGQSLLSEPRFRRVFGVTTFLVVLTIFSQHLGLNLVPRFYETSFPSGTFGHPNMAAQFLGIAILLFLPRSWKLSWGTLFLLSLVGCLFLQGSRATLIALTAGVAIRLYFFGGLRPRVVFSSFLLAILLLVPLSLYALKPELRDFKLKSRINRVTKWSNTVSLVAENPWGVGPGNFPFVYPYFSNAVTPDPEVQKEVLLETPHNWPLEILSEWGLLAGLAALLLVSRHFWKLFKVVKDDQQGGLLLSAGVFLFVNALLDFPFSNPFPFFTLGFFLGVSLRMLQKGEARAVSLLHLILGLPLGVLLILFTTAEYTLWTYPYDYARNDWACRIFPSTWEACLRTAEMDVEMNQPEKAIEKLTQKIPMGNRNPYSATTLFLAYLDTHLFDEACRVYRVWKDSGFTEEEGLQRKFSHYCL